jgi:hypothetical protein
LFEEKYSKALYQRKQATMLMLAGESQQKRNETSRNFRNKKGNI